MENELTNQNHWYFRHMNKRSLKDNSDNCLITACKDLRIKSFLISIYHPILVKPLHMSVSNITRVPILIHTMDMIKIRNSSITILIEKRCFGLINMFKKNFYVLHTDSSDAKNFNPIIIIALFQ